MKLDSLNMLIDIDQLCANIFLTGQFQGPRIWNSLPIDIKNAPTFSMFKRMIKPFLRVRQNTT